MIPRLVFILCGLAVSCFGAYEKHVIVDMSRPHDIVGYKNVPIKQGIVNLFNPFDEHRDGVSLSFGSWIDSAVDGDTICFDETNLTVVAAYYDHDCRLHWLDKTTYDAVDNLPIPPGKMEFRRYQNVETNLAFVGGIMMKTFPPVRVKESEARETADRLTIPVNPIRFSQSSIDECFSPISQDTTSRLVPLKFYVNLSDGKKAIGMVTRENTALRSFSTGEYLYVTPSMISGFSIINDGAFPKEECLGEINVRKLEKEFFSNQNDSNAFADFVWGILGDVRSWLICGLCTMICLAVKRRWNKTRQQKYDSTNKARHHRKQKRKGVKRF